MNEPFPRASSRSALQSQWAATVPVVLPSLLLCDFGNLASEIAQLETANVTSLHLDVMDGHFVPNLTYGPTIVAACRKYTELPLDCHLMIDEPRRYLKDFYQAGADSITVHIEAVPDPREVLAQIRDLGALAGLALNPGTPIAAVTPYLDDCDMLLVMSVSPGFGGQKFQSVALDKLRQLQKLCRPNMLLQVDGGVNLETIKNCAEAGAQLFVVGSAIFGHSDYAERVRQLTRLATR